MNLKVSQSIRAFFQLEDRNDILRVLKLPLLIALEAGKLQLTLDCNCQVSELNNWMTHTIRTPYYWRIRTPASLSFIAGPYSPIWYLLNQPAHYGFWPWMYYLLSLDVAFTIFNFAMHGWKWIMFYSLNSVYFFFNDPIDFFVFQFAMLGVYSWKISLFDIFFKLPWFPLPFSTPAWFPFPTWDVWHFVLNNPYGYHESPLRYVQLGIVWFVPIVLYYHRRRKKSLSDSGRETLRIG